jgi:hypothetical protein
MQSVGQDKALPFLANQRRQRVAYAGLLSIRIFQREIEFGDGLNGCFSCC